MENESLIEKLHRTATDYRENRANNIINNILILMEEAASKGNFFIEVYIDWEDKEQHMANIMYHFEELGFRVKTINNLNKPCFTIDWKRLPKNK